MKKLLIAVLVLSALSVSLEAFAEQETVFCGETSSYRAGRCVEQMFVDDCNRSCTANYSSCGLEPLLADGWKVDATMLKGLRTKSNMYDTKVWYDGVCTCNGTQYVLSKVEKKVDAAPEPDRNTALLNKEIELLKKENEMLKQEIGTLKKKTAKKKQ